MGQVRAQRGFVAILAAAGSMTAGSATFVCGCGGGEPIGIQGQIGLDTERPALAATPEAPPEYTGSDPFVLEAVENHRTALDLHRNVVLRTCGPTSGVCHNQKEYPDLHTPGNLLAAIGAPCNVQSADPAGVFDGCEQTGDRLVLGEGRETEIGYVDYVPGEYIDYEEQGITPDVTSPGLHIILHDPIEAEEERQQFWSTARFTRTFINSAEQVSDIEFGGYQTKWWILENGTRLLGEVRDYQTNDVNELLSVGIEQGDRNRNGIYGARESAPLPLINAGRPEESYIVGRLRGILGARDIPGTRMPLANTPLSISDMLAVFCFIEGLPPEGTEMLDMSAPINYQNCSYSTDPEALNLLGKGVTWLGRIRPLLEANCGGCHGGTAPQGGLNLLADNVYDTLLGPSIQRPELPLVDPLNPEGSYLWQKLVGAEGIVGLPMPLDPLEGVRTLPEAALGDVRTWIENGALQED